MNERKRPQRVIAALVFAACAAFAISSPAATAAADTPISSDSTPFPAAPEFTLLTTAGPFDLASVKMPVLLEVFATWCPHCQRETAVLNELSRKYRRRVAIVAVTGSPYSDPELRLPETQSDVDAFVKTFDVRYPVAFDPDLGVARRFIGTGYPTIVVIDRQKKISYANVGEIPDGPLEKALDAALAE
jgi:thiol-disulfide isomerase/thioredoxin